MMFYLLCAALCLSVLFLVTAAGQVVCTAVQRVLRPWLRRASPRVAANLLFGTQIVPVLAALVVTFAFAAPAFLEFEPRSTGEGMGWKLILLSVAGMLLVITFVTSAARSLWATAKVDREWTGHSQPLRIQGFDLPIYCVEGGVPFLAVTGLLRAKVFVGRPVVELLSPSELRAALEHEAAHVRSFDNVKQLLLKSMLLWNKSRGQVAMWLHSSEAAADEEALAGGASALELSAALVKIGRVTRQPNSPSPVLASQFLPCHATSSLSTRIRRLEQRLENPLSPEKMKVSRRASRVGLAVSLAAILVYSGYIHMLLPQIHEMLEILVR